MPPRSEQARASQDVCIFSSKAFGKVMLLDGMTGSLPRSLTWHWSSWVVALFVSLHQHLI